MQMQKTIKANIKELQVGFLIGGNGRRITLENKELVDKSLSSICQDILGISADTVFFCTKQQCIEQQRCYSNNAALSLPGVSLTLFIQHFWERHSSLPNLTFFMIPFKLQRSSKDFI